MMTLPLLTWVCMLMCMVTLWVALHTNTHGQTFAAAGNNGDIIMLTNQDDLHHRTVSSHRPHHPFLHLPIHHCYCCCQIQHPHVLLSLLL